MAAPFVPLFNHQKLRGTSPGQFARTPAIVLNADSASPDAAGGPATEVAGPEEPSPIISLKQEGDIVKEIRVQCACGGVIDLECEY